MGKLVLGIKGPEFLGHCWRIRPSLGLPTLGRGNAGLSHRITQGGNKQGAKQAGQAGGKNLYSRFGSGALGVPRGLKGAHRARGG